MKFLLAVTLLTMMASTLVQANDTIVVSAVVRVCQEDTSAELGLLDTLKLNANTKCLQVSGYPNARMESKPTYRRRVVSFGYPGCSLISNVSLEAEFKCLNKNK